MRDCVAWTEHSAIFLTFMKVPFVIKMFYINFEWPLKPGFIVPKNLYLLRQVVRTSVFAYT